MNIPYGILNPQALLSLYEEFPSLNGCEVMEILFKRDEPKVSIKIMTGDKPKHIPVRWPQSFDVIYLGISFVGVRSIVQRGWGHANIVDQFKIEKSSDSASLLISCSNDFSLSFDCDWISVDSVVPGSIGTP